MKMTAEGLALIMEFEGFRSRAYKCPAGIWTIGYGHTSHAGPPAVHHGLELSRDEASAILARDVEMFAAGVRELLKIGLNDQQFSALVSFAYNVGLGNLRSSSVIKAVNAGDLTAVPRRLQLWNKADGKVLPGLVRRRAAEAELFAGQMDQGSVPPRTAVTASAGKPLGQSTTAAAAAVSMAAGTTAAITAAKSESVGWLVGGLLMLVIAAAGAWIIRERIRKSTEEGI